MVFGRRTAALTLTHHTELVTVSYYSALVPGKVPGAITAPGRSSVLVVENGA